ncbi:MAG: MarR family winged helix-turn-helix transcriptional regulator [Sphingomonadaceae bacterium]
MKSIRLLAECMQSFERLSAERVRQCGLTHAQFDIIATLGNTPGMSYKELGDKTLITKGTLTGVIERLEHKGLVERERSVDDKRSYYIRLSKQGEQVFHDVFPKVIDQGRQVFAQYSDADFTALEQTLTALKTIIIAGASPGAATHDSTKEII